MALIDNLVSYWKLDETSGTRADSHGSNNLTDNNTVGYDTGKINNAANFIKANSEYLSIADASQTGLEPANITINAWVKLKSNTFGQYFLQKAYTTTWTPPYMSYRIGTDGDAGRPIVQMSAGGSASSVIGTTVLTTSGGWYMVSATYDGTTWKIYLNGTQENSASKSAITYSNGNFVIGTELPNSVYFDGYIDEVGIWSRALSGAEITSLYNSGAGLAYPFTTTSIKDVNGLQYAAVKTVNGLNVASVKNIMGLA